MISDLDAAQLADPELGCPACKIIIDSGELQATAWINKPLCSAEVYHATDKLCVMTYSYRLEIMGDSELRNLASQIGTGMHAMAKHRAALNLTGTHGNVTNDEDLAQIEQWAVSLSRMLKSKGLVGYK